MWKKSCPGDTYSPLRKHVHGTLVVFNKHGQESYLEIELNSFEQYIKSKQNNKHSGKSNICKILKRAKKHVQGTIMKVCSGQIYKNQSCTFNNKLYGGNPNS